MMPETREERTQTEDGTEHAESITSFKLDWTSSGIIKTLYIYELRATEPHGTGSRSEVLVTYNLA